MSKDNEYCSTCGATVVEYPHSLSKQLVGGLVRLAQHGTANLQDIGLTKNQYNNFQKLGYWGLASRTGEHGEWQLTKRGLSFLAYRTSEPRQVWTYRGAWVRDGIPLTTIVDLVGEEYWQHEDYANLRRPHNNEIGDLFDDVDN